MKIYYMTKDQFNRLDNLLTNFYEFAEGMKAEGMLNVIKEFDNEVFDTVRVNQQREEDP